MENKLQDLLNRDDCYIIHYASNGFYNGSSPAPKISCIVIFNKKNQEEYRFSLQDHLQGHSKEEAEKLSLENFKLLFEKNPLKSYGKFDINLKFNLQKGGFTYMQASKMVQGLTCPNCEYTGSMETIKVPRISFWKGFWIIIIACLIFPVIILAGGPIFIGIGIAIINFFFPKRVAVCPSCNETLDF